VPAGLQVTTTTTSSITWVWAASADSGGGTVKGYKVTLYDATNLPVGGADIGNALTWTADGLNAGSTYALRVRAYDNAVPPNESALCAAVTGTTKKRDPRGKVK
jgi:hypothetical protein